MSFYQSGRPDDLASSIQEALIKETGAVNKGVRPANFHVLRENAIPATLIEMGFLTNAPEAAQLANDNYQNRLADGICKGIIIYFQSRL
jgi:N-acetylmuramoyl-L-alanine amidase